MTDTQDYIMSDEGELMEELCGDTKSLSESQIMVNIIKVKDEGEMLKYMDAVVWNMFPTIESRIHVAGEPKSDYWDQVCCYKAQLWLGAMDSH